MLKKINIRAVIRFIFFGYLACLTFFCLYVFLEGFYLGLFDSLNMFIFLYNFFSLVMSGLFGYYFQRKKEKLKSGFCYFMWVFFQAFMLMIIYMPSFDSELNCSDSGGIWVYEERECYYDCKDGEEKDRNCITLRLKEGAK